MKGFTLLETLITVVILSFLLITLFNVYNLGRVMFNNNTGIMDTMQMVRKSMDGMVKEIRQSRPGDIIISSGGSQIQFMIPMSVNPLVYSDTIAYFVSNNQLIREHPPGSTQIVGSNVNAINFLLVSDRLEVDLQARAPLHKRAVVFPLRETVTLRN